MAPEEPPGRQSHAGGDEATNVFGDSAGARSQNIDRPVRSVASQADRYVPEKVDVDHSDLADDGYVPFGQRCTQHDGHLTGSLLAENLDFSKSRMAAF